LVLLPLPVTTVMPFPVFVKGVFDATHVTPDAPEQVTRTAPAGGALQPVKFGDAATA